MAGSSQEERVQHYMNQMHVARHAYRQARAQFNEGLVLGPHGEGGVFRSRIADVLKTPLKYAWRDPPLALRLRLGLRRLAAQ